MWKHFDESISSYKSIIRTFFFRWNRFHVKIQTNEKCNFNALNLPDTVVKSMTSHEVKGVNNLAASADKRYSPIFCDHDDQISISSC